jgi:hypothetical protein
MRRHVLPKRRFVFNRLRDVISQNIELITEVHIFNFEKFFSQSTINWPLLRTHFHARRHFTTLRCCCYLLTGNKTCELLAGRLSLYCQHPSLKSWANVIKYALLLGPLAHINLISLISLPKRHQFVLITKFIAIYGACGGIVGSDTVTNPKIAGSSLDEANECLDRSNPWVESASNRYEYHQYFWW